MPGQSTLINNLLRNGNFSKFGADWTTQDSVDYSRQYCRVLTGQASQVIDASAETTYLLEFWSQVLFKGNGTLSIRSNAPGADLEVELNDFHVWRWQQISFTTPPATTLLTVAITGTSGEVCVDEMQLTLDTGIPPRPELVLNGDFSNNMDHWSTEGSPIGSRTHFDGNTLECALGGRARQTVPVTGGNTYEFSFRSRSDFGGHGFCRFEVEPSGTFAEIRVDASSWTTYPEELAMPASATALTIILIGIDGAEFFDDVSLRRKA